MLVRVLLLVAPAATPIGSTILDSRSARVINGSYTSCRRDDPAHPPAWELRSDSLTIDLDASRA